jgi:hypothetical protein
MLLELSALSIYFRRSRAEQEAFSFHDRTSNSVSSPADGLDQLHFVVSIHFAPQEADKGVDRIFFHVVIGVPHRIDNRVSFNNPASTPHQEFQQSGLCLAQGNFLAGASCLVRARVQD